MRILCVCVMLPWSLLAQFEPDTAQVDLFFPQLADGGDQRQTWQTSFVFYNPNRTSAVTCILSITGDDGRPLPLDLGSGLAALHTVSLPPLGRRTLRSRMLSRVTVTGYAYAGCSLPVQATVLFRTIVNGTPQVEISAPGTLPTSGYRSIANRAVGIALVNVYTTPVTLVVTAYDSEGGRVGSRSVTLCGQCHTSFNPSSFPNNFPRDFEGTVTIYPTDDRPTNIFVAWTLNSEGGLLSSLPSGGQTWPGQHLDRVRLIFAKLLNIAQQVGLADVSSTKLNYNPSQVVNAYASSDGTVHITTALAELIADSPSELASVIGHELGHIIQFKTGRPIINPTNKELDADAVGMLLSLGAGYDPYAGAGAMGKLMMIAQKTDIFHQLYDDLTDPHTSFTNRIGVMFTTLQLVCATPGGQTFCPQYRSVIHPSFPPSLPLSVGQRQLELEAPAVQSKN